MKILGIDTGGTFTDGAIVDRDSYRVLRTSKALTTPWDLTVGLENCIDGFAAEELREAELICLSTTLATNAILEGRGCRAGLVLMGSVPEGRLPVDEYIYLPARIDIRGGVQNSLIPEYARKELEAVRGRYEALAVSGYSSVRNPTHEEQLRVLAWEVLDIPVVCAHELTGQLGFYERTITAVLNARLIPIIRQLIDSVDEILARRGLDIPVMLVRGDGSLMRREYAMERPVETILSGPAASMLGACFLSGMKRGLVADMGGTSLDIVRVEDGEAAISEEGATVDGWKTRVRALDIHTYALGGDSHITVNEKRQIFLGPRKVVPYCRSAYIRGENGLTPTDIVHVTGEFTAWDREASERGAAAFAKETGVPAGEIAQMLSDRIAELAAQDIRKSESLYGMKEASIIGAGAPAGVWLRKAAGALGREIIVPEHAEVANAVGAAAGKIVELSLAQVRFDRRNDRWNVFSEIEYEKLETYEAAVERARQIVEERVAEKAGRAGAKRHQISLFEQEERDSAGRFIEYRVKAVASGMP